jgi:biotin transport system substrate-specific component
MKQPQRSFNALRMPTCAILLAALAGAGAQITFPLATIPVALQNLFVMLAGLLLGPWWGLVSVGIYLLGGLLGLPVLPGGAGGVRCFLGASGGYLLGFLPAVLIIGLISARRRHHWMRDVLAVVCGGLAIYVPGVVWLKLISRMQWSAAVSVGMLPFLAADALKTAVAVAAAGTLRRMTRHSPSQPV